MNAMMEFIDKTVAPEGSIALFWFEQNHFAIKTSKGVLIHIDPFLSRAVKPEIHIHPEALMRPEEAKADFVFLTHDHRDHADPHTIEPMARANPKCRFAGTPEACARCRTLGVGEERLTEMREGDRRDFGDFSVRAVYAQNTSERDATTHLGFVFDFLGIVVYDAGDTRKNPDEYVDRMKAVSGLRPDVMLVPINSGYNNPGPAGAARLVEWVDPLLVVPCHYDCFKHNTIDPREFVDASRPERRAAIRIPSRGERIFVRSIRSSPK